MALKMCPHSGCERMLNPGAIFNAHANACPHHPERAALDAAKTNGRRRRSTSPVPTKSPFVTPPISQSWLLWDRGKWRGWAVGKVSKIEAGIVKIKSGHFGHQLSWQESQLAKDVTEGRVFITDPTEVLDLIRTQLAQISVEDEVAANPLRLQAMGLLREARETLEGYRAAVEKIERPS